jgi:enoyl-CoA hydratase/carnithine racemase
MSLPQYDTVSLEMQGEHVLIARLNRPEVLNAINTQMGHDLLALWTSLTVDAKAVRCVVLTGAGERGFCAGGDLKERNGMSNEDWRMQHELFERGAMALWDCPVPVIAAVNGAAFGGGCETALSCDFIYASSTARFALTEVRLGIMPGAGGTQNLPRAVGERRAKELIYAARPFSAEEAHHWGMVNAVFEPAELLPAAVATAEAIAGNAPMSIRQAKKSVRYGADMDLATGYRFEIEAYNRLVGSQDRLEGVLAFNEKRKANFKGY